MSDNHRLNQAIKDGIKIPEDGYWGDVPSKICGAYGGAEGESAAKEVGESYENKLVNRQNK